MTAPVADGAMPYVAGLFASVMAAVIAYFGGKGSAQAALQNSLNEAVRDILHEREDQRKEDHDKVTELIGHVRQLEQWAISLENILREQNIPIPPRPLMKAVFVLEANMTPEEKKHG